MTSPHTDHSHDHPPGQAHDHDHDHSHGLGGHHHGTGKVLIFSLCITAAFAIIEVVGGLWANSLALLSDAGHMVTDSASLGVGAFAAWLATRPASNKHSFGLQRAEVLGALFNSLFMIAIVAVIAVEAIRRFFEPAPVEGSVVLWIGAIGLVINIAVAAILLKGEQTMNVRGALIHVMGDLLGSVAALAAGVIIMLTNWYPVDPILSLLVSALILVSALRLLREVVHVIMEGVPKGMDAAEVGRALNDVEGVVAIHDLHIWSLSSTSHALSAHIEIDVMEQWDRVLPELQRLLAEQFKISHTTLQPENQATAQHCVTDPECGVAV